jgi:cytochrome P450
VKAKALSAPAPKQQLGVRHLLPLSTRLVHLLTSLALNVLTFYLLDNPAILEKVTKEVKSIVTDTTNIPSWSQLEQLPYLGACITEAIRIGSSVPCRLSRIAPDETLHYSGIFKGKPVEWSIPPGTTISMANILVHENEDIFPQADKFIPERWLREDGSRRTDLERYLLSFSKGTRMCLGIK